jgi:hypothetical protein
VQFSLHVSIAISSNIEDNPGGENGIQHIEKAMGIFRSELLVNYILRKVPH